MIRYKQNRWLGPGKVVCQDGKLIVSMRHGGVFIRVSPNRLIKVEDQFKFKSDGDHHDDVGDGMAHR